MESVTTLPEINRLLAETVQEEKAVELRLQEVLLRAFELQPKVLALNAARSQLEVVQQDSQELLQTITAAAAVADGVSSKVREIDLSRSRLQEVAERVEKIASSKQAAEELEMALDNGEYEEAADIVRRFLGAVGPPHLIEGMEAFGKAVDERLSDAEALGDVAAISRFARLGAALGGERRALGMKRFAKYLRGVVAKTAKTHREQLAQADGKGEVGAHLGCFSAILQVVAGVAGEQRQTILEHFGATGLSLLLDELQLECDAQASAVIRRFTEKRKIAQLCSLASAATQRTQSQGRSMRGLAAAPAVPGLEPQAVNGVLDELAMISDRATSYENYMAEQLSTSEEAQREEADAGAGGEARDRTAQLAPRSRSKTGLRLSVQEAIGLYVPLEVYLVSYNLQRAVSSDTLPSISADELAEATLQGCGGHSIMPASTVVDEVFFVLQAALRRAVAFANEDAAAAVINHVMGTLEGEYKGYLEEQLEYHRETTLSAVGDTLGLALGVGGISMRSFSMKGLAAKSPARGGGGSGAAAGGVERHPARSGEARDGGGECAVPPFAIYLNDVQLSVDYVGKLATSIGEALDRQASTGGGGSNHKRATPKWKAALQEMSAAEQLRQLLDKAISKLFDTIYPKLKASADAFKEMDFVADDAKLTSWAVDDPWAHSFVQEMSSILGPLAGQLTPSNYDRVVLQTAQTVAERSVPHVLALLAFVLLAATVGCT